jgi:hypothetical protein
VSQKFPFVFKASQTLPAAPRDMDATWIASFDSLKPELDLRLTMLGLHAQVPGYATKVLMKTDLQNLPGRKRFSTHPIGHRDFGCHGTFTKRATNLSM